MINFYQFESDGWCKCVTTFSSEEDALFYANGTGATSFVISQTAIAVEKAKLVNGLLVEAVRAKPFEVRCQEVKVERNVRLVSSDWTDTVSASVRLGNALYTSWQTYRQALRDITEQPGFPDAVVWPTPPV